MAYGNLAYKHEYDHEEYTQLNTTYDNKPLRQPQLRRSKRCAIYIARIAAVALSAAFMVSTFISVHDTKLVVSNLTVELEAAEAFTNQKAFDLEHSYNLTEIEEEATSRLGMQRPESYQYVYINVKQQDTTEKTAKSEEGAIKHFGELLSSFFGNIVDFFSIK